MGAGGWWADHDDNGSNVCTGLWENGEVIALLVGREENCDTDYLKEKGDVIVRAVNSHDQLVAALKKAQKDINWMLNSQQFLNGFVFKYIEEALASAGEQS